MFNYLEIEKEEAKKLIKYVTEKDYKRGTSHFAPPKTALLRAFSKAELSRVDFSTMKAYANKNFVNPDDEVMVFYNKLIDRKLSETISFHSKLQNLVNNGKYEELSEDTKDEIEQYRASFDSLGVPISFDSYIKFLCVPSDSSIEKLNADKSEQKIKELENKINKIQEEYNSLAKDFNDQVKQIRVKNNEIDRLKSQIAEYEQMVSIGNVVGKLSDLLPKDYRPQSYEEVYKELEKYELQYYENNEFEKCKQILSAKFALINIIEHKEG